MTPLPRFPMAKISAVVSDVDGTLVTDDKFLTARAVEAVADLRANKIVFSIVSSRPPRGLRILIESLGITAPIGGFNGGVIATPGLATLTQHLLLPQVAWRAVETLEAQGVQAWIFAGQDWFARKPNAPYMDREERTVGFAPTIVDSFGSVFDVTAKIVGVSADFERLAQCEDHVRSMLANQASVARSQPYYLDITHPLANKGLALLELAKLLALPLAEIAVIGDGGNDVAMFERSGLSIAMGNACPHVRRAADFVTESNGEEGFAKAIERFILGHNPSNRRIGFARQGDSA
jgi:Cof subfamily protein (haloacid dehalogenase superfamily)